MLLLFKSKPARLVEPARCIVGGHLAKDAGVRATYIRTALGAGHCARMLVAATQKWRLQSFDVTAFLQGEELLSDRVLYMRLPRRLSDDVLGQGAFDVRQGVSHRPGAHQERRLRPR